MQTLFKEQSTNIRRFIAEAGKLSIVLLVLLVANNSYSQQADVDLGHSKFKEIHNLGDVAQSDVSISDNSDSGYLITATEPKETVISKLQANKEKRLVNDVGQNATSLFQICVSNAGKEKMKIDDPLYDLCNSYIKNNIKRMKTDTDLKS
jgi:Fe2+ transport system protein B